MTEQRHDFTHQTIRKLCYRVLDPGLPIADLAGQ